MMPARAVQQQQSAWGAQRTLRRLDLFYLTTLALAMALHALRVGPDLCQATISAGSRSELALHTDIAAGSLSGAHSGNTSSCFSQGLLHRAGCGCLLTPRLRDHLCGAEGFLRPWYMPGKLAWAMLVAVDAITKVPAMTLVQPWLLENPPLGVAPWMILTHLLVILAPWPVLKRRPRSSSSQHAGMHDGSTLQGRSADAPQQQQQQAGKGSRNVGAARGPSDLPAASGQAAAAAASGQRGRRSWFHAAWHTTLRSVTYWHVTWRHPDRYWKTPGVRVTAALLLRLGISGVRALSVGPFMPPGHLLPYHPGSTWPHMNFMWASWQACCVLLPLHLQFMTTTWEWAVTVYICHRMDGPLLAAASLWVRVAAMAGTLLLTVGPACAASWFVNCSWGGGGDDTSSSSNSSSDRRSASAGGGVTAAAAQQRLGANGGSGISPEDTSDWQKVYCGQKLSNPKWAEVASSSTSSAQGSCRASFSSGGGSRRTSLSRRSPSVADGEGASAQVAQQGAAGAPLPDSAHVMPVRLQEQLLALFGQEVGADLIRQVHPQPAVLGTYTATTATLPVSIKVHSDHGSVDQVGRHLKSCLQRCTLEEEQHLAAAAPAGASRPRVFERSVCFAGCVQLLGSVYFTAGSAEGRQRAALATQRVLRRLCHLLSADDVPDQWHTSPDQDSGPSHLLGTRQQQQQRQRQQQQEEEGGDVPPADKKPLVEVVVDGLASALGDTNHRLQPDAPQQQQQQQQQASVGMQLLYMEPAVLAAAPADGLDVMGLLESHQHAALCCEEQQELGHPLYDRQQQELVLVLEHTQQQQPLGSTAAAAGGKQPEPGSAACAGSAHPTLCRLLVFTDQMVVMDEVVVLQQRLRLVVPPLPAGYYHIALLPHEEDSSHVMAQLEERSNPSVTQTSSSSSSSSSRSWGRGSRVGSSAPLVLQPMVVLPYRAACEVQHLWEAAARAMGSLGTSGLSPVAALEGCGPLAAAHLQQAAEARALQGKVVVWDTVLSGLVQDMAAVLALTTPGGASTPPSTATTSSSSRQGQPQHAGHAHAQQQQQEEEEEGEGRAAIGRRSFARERVSEVVDLQQCLMPLLRFLSTHHMWNAAQWLCLHLGAHVAAATHAAAGSGSGSIARTSHNSSAGSGDACLGSRSNSLLLLQQRAQPGAGGGGGGGGGGSQGGLGQQPVEGGPWEVDVSPSAAHLPAIHVRGAAIDRWDPAGSQGCQGTAPAAGCAWQTMDHRLSCSRPGMVVGSHDSSSRGLLDSQRLSSSRAVLVDSAAAGEKLRPLLAQQAAQQQRHQQQQQRQQGLAAAAAVEVAQHGSDNSWRRRCRQLLRGFHDPYLEEAFLLAISSSCHWADSLAICLPLVPLATSGVTSGVLRRVADIGLAAGLAGRSGELAAFTAFGVVPLVLLALVGPAVVLGRRHELMHGICEMMMASFAACQILGWGVLRQQWSSLLGLDLINSCVLGGMLVIRPLLRQVRLHVQLPWMVLEGLMLLLLAHRHLGTCVLPLLVARSSAILAVGVGLLGAVEAWRRQAFLHSLCQAAT